MILKDTFTFENRSFQLSAVRLKDYNIFEIMVFPIEYGVVSGNEVYCFRTGDAKEAINKYRDIYYYSKNYVSEEAIEKYLKEKEDWFNT